MILQSCTNYLGAMDETNNISASGYLFVRNLKVKRTRRNWFGSAPPYKKNSQIKSLVLECHVLEGFAMVIALFENFRNVWRKGKTQVTLQYGEW